MINNSSTINETMKRIWLGALFFLIVLIGALLYWMIRDQTKCSVWNKDNCDFSCVVDADCQIRGCCSCMNAHEKCSTTRGLQAVDLNCIYSTCKCESGKCVSHNPVIDALNNKSVS